METIRTPFPKDRFGGSLTGLGWRRPAEASAPGGEPLEEAEVPSRQERIAYGALLFFVALIYITPGTLYPPLEDVPIAKGVAVISFLFLFSAIRAKGASWRLADPTTLWLIAFVAIGGLSIATSLWRLYSLNAFLDVLKLILVYLLVIHLVDRLERVRQLFWVMLWAGMVPAGGTLAHYLLKIDLVEGYRGAWRGVYADPNDLAYHLIVLVPIGLSLLEAERSFVKRCWVFGILTVFMLAIYVTFSRGGLVGLMIVFFFQILRSRNRMLHFFLATILLMVLLAVAPARYWERAETILKFRHDESAMGRVYAWQAGLSMVADRPLLGVGLGCFVMGWPIYAPSDAGTKWRAAHNTFVAVMGETGLLGLAAFGAFIGTSLRRVQKVNRATQPTPRPLFHPSSIEKKESAPVDAPAAIEADRRRSLYARGVEIALWGFLACSLTLGIARSWPPYLFAGLAVALWTLGTVNRREARGELK
jgi:probable O-glycosylation ligase (exosortase A-associated)